MSKHFAVSFKQNSKVTERLLYLLVFLLTVALSPGAVAIVNSIEASVPESAKPTGFITLIFTPTSTPTAVRGKKTPLPTQQLPTLKKTSPILTRTPTHIVSDNNPVDYSKYVLPA